MTEQSEAEKAAEMGRSAAEYCKNIRTEIPNIEEASADSIVWNLRFMAYCAGYRAGSASAAPKWIKCSEKPPPDEEVLVVWNGIVCTGWYTPEYGDLRACWEISGRNLPVTDLAEVTHWMNKPAAPEVEK